MVRYARALFGLAVDKGTFEAVGQEPDALAATVVRLSPNGEEPEGGGGAGTVRGKREAPSEILREDRRGPPLCVVQQRAEQVWA